MFHYNDIFPDKDCLQQHPYLSIGPLGREITDIGTLDGCCTAVAVFRAALGLVEEEATNVHHLYSAAVPHAQVVGYHIMLGGLAWLGSQGGVRQGLGGGHYSLPHLPWRKSLLVVVVGEMLRQLSTGTSQVVHIAAGHNVQGVVVADGDNAAAAAGANVHVPTCHQR